jgi:hypothetical protein
MKTNYTVAYTRAIGGQSSIIVTAMNEKEALSHAKFNRFTGRDFKVVGITTDAANAHNQSQAI